MGGVDVGRAGIEEVHVTQRGDLALRVAEPVHGDVHRDVDAEFFGQLPVMTHDIGLAEAGSSCGEAHGDPVIVGAEVLRSQTARLVTVRGQHTAGVVGAEPPVHERGVGEAIGEDRPDARLLERR